MCGAEPQGWSSGVSREGYSRRDGETARYPAERRATLLDSPGGAPNNGGPSRARTRHRRYLHVANIKSAKKRARQAIKRRAHNVAMRSKVRNSVRKVLKAVAAGDKEAAAASFKAVVPEIDRMATKGILRKSRAAHYKSQLNAKLRAMT